MCINCQRKFDIFGSAVVMTFIAGIGITLPLMALALVNESEKEKENEWSIKDLEDCLDALES